MIWVGLAIGIFLGIWLGFLTCALLVIARRSDQDIQAEVTTHA